MRSHSFTMLDYHSGYRHQLFFIGFLLIYTVNLIIAKHLGIRETGEVLPLVVIFGGIFPLLAWLITRNSVVPTSGRPVQRNEAIVVFALVLYISAIIIPGNKIFFIGNIDGIAGEWATLIRKVLTFVVIPFAVYRLLYRFNSNDFGLSFKWNKAVVFKSLSIWVMFSALLILLNYFAGTAAKPLKDGTFSTMQILKAVPLLSVWLFIEVGLVEEFFFRGFLQNRLGILLRSKTGAVCISALIFGLVHAPGMFLRQAGIHEGLGAEPSLLNSIVYCIAIQSIPGLFLGILWERTRNLWLLMGIHAMFDLLPGLPEFITTWAIR